MVPSLLLAVALAVRLVPLAWGLESTDIHLYRQQATAVVRGQNLYAVTTNVFPYTPVSMPYPALCLMLAARLGMPFDVVVKLFAIAADSAIALVLYGFGRRVLPRRTAVARAALYAVNPVSILVSSFHGNVMPFVVLLMLAAYLLFRIDAGRHLVTSGLLLGLAVGWRSFPILLLPFFLAAIDGSDRRVRFALCAVAPVAIAMLPFAWLDAGSMLREVLGYSGWGIHHGPWAVARGLYLVSRGVVTWANPPQWAPWMAASKLGFLALYGIAVLSARRLGLLNGILVTFFLFYAVYSGVASQYLVWVVPFLLVADHAAMFWSYEIAAAYALVVFYWLFFPDILFGAAPVPAVETASLLAQYVVSQVLLSSVCALALLVFGVRAAWSRPGRVPSTSAGPPRLGIVGSLVCVYYAVVLSWEVLFVLAIERS